MEDLAPLTVKGGMSTGDHGNKFQAQVLILLAWTATKRKVNYELYTEIKEAGKLDDAILIEVSEKGRKQRLYQAKHHDENSLRKGAINESELFQKNLGSPLTLLKYVKSFYDVERLRGSLHSPFSLPVAEVGIVTNRHLSAELKENYSVEDTSTSPLSFNDRKRRVYTLNKDYFARKLLLMSQGVSDYEDLLTEVGSQICSSGTLTMKDVDEESFGEKYSPVNKYYYPLAMNVFEMVSNSISNTKNEAKLRSNENSPFLSALRKEVGFRRKYKGHTRSKSLFVVKREMKKLKDDLESVKKVADEIEALLRGHDHTSKIIEKEDFSDIVNCRNLSPQERILRRKFIELTEDPDEKEEIKIKLNDKLRHKFQTIYSSQEKEKPSLMKFLSLYKDLAEKEATSEVKLKKEDAQEMANWVISKKCEKIVISSLFVKNLGGVYKEIPHDRFDTLEKFRSFLKSLRFVVPNNIDILDDDDLRELPELPDGPLIDRFLSCLRIYASFPNEESLTKELDEEVTVKLEMDSEVLMQIEARFRSFMTEKQVRFWAMSSQSPSSLSFSKLLQEMHTKFSLKAHLRLFSFQPEVLSQCSFMPDEKICDFLRSPKRVFQIRPDRYDLTLTRCYQTLESLLASKEVANYTQVGKFVILDKEKSFQEHDVNAKEHNLVLAVLEDPVDQLKKWIKEYLQRPQTKMIIIATSSALELEDNGLYEMSTQFETLTQDSKDEILMRKSNVQGKDIALEDYLQGAEPPAVLWRSVLDGVLTLDSSKLIAKFFYPRSLRKLPTFQLEGLLNNDDFFVVVDTDGSLKNLDGRMHNKIRKGNILISPHQPPKDQIQRTHHLVCCNSKFYYRRGPNNWRVEQYIGEEKEKFSVEYLHNHIMKHKVTLLCDKAGAGKSEVMNEVRRMSPHIALFLDKTIRKDGEMSASIKYLTGTGKLMIDYLWRSKEPLILILDAMDEITRNQDDVIDGLSSLLRRENTHLVVTSRPNEEDKLIEKLGAVPFRIIEFNDEERLEFLKKTGLDESAITEIVSEMQDKNFFRIPLHISMIAEVYKTGEIPENRLQLYEMFISQKFEEYRLKFKKDASIYMNKARSPMQRLAIVDYFSPKVVKAVYRSGVTDFPLEELGKTGIMVCTGDTPEFYHSTFKEYLCAEFIVDRIKDDDVIVDAIKEMMDKFFLSPGQEDIMEFVNDSLSAQEIKSSPECQKKIGRILAERYAEKIKTLQTS